jgi:hypothetical protein
MPGSCDVLHRSLLELRDFAADIGLVKVLKGEVGATRGWSPRGFEGLQSGSRSSAAQRLKDAVDATHAFFGRSA